MLFIQHAHQQLLYTQQWHAQFVEKFRKKRLVIFGNKHKNNWKMRLSPHIYSKKTTLVTFILSI